MKILSDRRTTKNGRMLVWEFKPHAEGTLVTVKIMYAFVPFTVLVVECSETEVAYRKPGYPDGWESEVHRCSVDDFVEVMSDRVD